MTNEELQDLLRRYREGKCSEEEKSAVEKWYSDQIEGADWDFAPGQEAAIKTQILERLSPSHSTPNRTKRIPLVIRRIAAAAAILLFISTAGYFLILNKKSNVSVAKINTKENGDITPPETNRAVVTLANGAKIFLDSLGNGSILKEGSVSLTKLADGQLAYNGSSTETLYNTLYNPRGSKAINLTLSDGTKVWLNSESSLRYPAAFNESERKVEITGEAYFEVAHNPQKPFKVSKGEMEVTVLGTHFNVNAYDDENDIKVTLLEGSVKASGSTNSVILKPGQQALAKSGSPISINQSPDIEQVMAWKNELFLVKNADIKTVMRQIARWYNVDIEYKGEVTEKFIVDINRNTNVSNVFKILEATGGVKFNIDGRKIMVMP